jgi:hypothetical protein
MSLAPAANVANIVAVTGRQTLGGQPDPRLLTMIQRTYAMPLVDRMLRHETVEWAAAIASRRGWRLSLYGRGWDLHPRLGQFARGEVAHGEMLREVYVGAAAHLHVSATALVHQRVLECFLSGGLCLTRVHRDGLSGPRTTMNQALLARGPDAENVERGLGYRVADHPEAMVFVSLVQRLGLGDAAGVWDGRVWIPRAKADGLRRMGELIAQDHDANWLLGDLATLSFGTSAQLEERLQWAVEGGTERERWIDAVRRRIENHLTHDAMVARLVGALTSDAKTESRAAA